MQTRWSVTGELPCDVHLVTLRTMLEGSSPAQVPHQFPSTASFTPSPLAALLLHRVGFDCGFNSPGLSCSTNGGKVCMIVNVCSVIRISQEPILEYTCCKVPLAFCVCPLITSQYISASHNVSHWEETWQNLHTTPFNQYCFLATFLRCLFYISYCKL